MHTALKEVNEKAQKAYYSIYTGKSQKENAPDKKSKWVIPWNERRGFYY